MGAFGRSGTTTFSSAYTLATADEGKILEFTGSSAAQLTLPSSWSGTRGAWPVFNKGTATLTIAGAASGSITVAAGESATIFRADSEWRVMPAGTFTAMS